MTDQQTTLDAMTETRPMMVPRSIGIIIIFRRVFSILFSNRPKYPNSGQPNKSRGTIHRVVKRFRQWLLWGLLAFSLAVSILAVVERFRSNRFDDGIMLPLPFHRTILIASRRLAWTDVLLLRDWPDRHAVAWWGKPFNSGGPAFVWDSTGMWIDGPLWIIRCHGTSPRVAPNGPPDYDSAFARDQWLRSQYPDNWPPPNNPNWIFVSAYKVQFPTLWWASFTVIWVPFLILAATRRLIGARTAMRERKRLCPTCGYDLRATPGRCPECGTIVTPKEIASS